MVDERIRAREHTRLHGEDIPEVRDWVWPDAGQTATEDSGTTYSGQTAGVTGGAAATGGDNE
jgi:xylulose-5-phosphate/fructose-6-phosphate phosphoketolase